MSLSFSRRPYTQGGQTRTRENSPKSRRPTTTTSQQLRLDRSQRTYTAHIPRPQTSQIKNSPRIGYSITRARIQTAKPIYQVKPLRNKRPQTTGSFSSLPAIIPSSRQWTALKKTDALQQETLEQLEYEMV